MVSGLSGPRTNPAGIKDEIQHFSGSHRICLRAEYVYKEHTCTNVTYMCIYVYTPLFILINDNLFHYLLFRKISLILIDVFIHENLFDINEFDR